jgi:predicted dehydrogenase
MLDQVLVLFGVPEEVDARMGVQRPGGKVDDYYDIRLRYKDFSAIVKSSYLVREEGPRYALHGTEGSYVKYGIDPQEQALKEGKIPGSTSWGYEPREGWGKLNVSIGTLHVEGVVETAVGNYLAYYDNIYDVLRQGKEPAVTAEQGRDVIRLIEACTESNRLRKAVPMA